MAQVEVISEREFKGGWSFEVQVLDDHGALSRHEVRLSWADYNLWSQDGADEPSNVIEAVMQFVTARTPPHDLPTKFNPSIARRKFPDADVTIPRLIRP